MRIFPVFLMGLYLIIPGAGYAGKFGGGVGGGFASLRSGRMNLNGVHNVGFKFGGGLGGGYAGKKSGVFTPISSVGDSWMEYEPSFIKKN